MPIAKNTKSTLCRSPRESLESADCESVLAFANHPANRLEGGLRHTFVRKTWLNFFMLPPKARTASFF